MSRIPNRPSPQALQRGIDEWNKKAPIGTAVTVRMDSGTLFETTTISEAWTLGGHTNVVKVDGIAGAYALNRVTIGHETNVEPA